MFTPQIRVTLGVLEVYTVTNAQELDFDTETF